MASVRAVAARRFESLQRLEDVTGRLSRSFGVEAPPIATNNRDAALAEVERVEGFASYLEQLEIQARTERAATLQAAVAAGIVESERDDARGRVQVLEQERDAALEKLQALEAAETEWRAPSEEDIAEAAATFVSSNFALARSSEESATEFLKRVVDEATAAREVTKSKAPKTPKK